MIPQTSSARWLAGIALAVAALAVTAVIVTIAAGSGDPEPLPKGTPQAAVQDYILAIDHGEFDAAYDLLDTPLRENCEASEFRRQIRFGEGADIRVRLETVRTFEDEADVTVGITSFSGSPPFDFSERTHTATFSLRQGEGWRITQAPYPFHGCPFSVPIPKPTATPVPPEATPDGPAVPVRPDAGS